MKMNSVIRVLTLLIFVAGIDVARATIPHSELQNVSRDYEATTGRYIQSDPIGLRAGLATFGYANGNPMSYIDPTGLLAMSLSDDECDRLERDIGWEKGTIRKLQRMMREGKNFRDYGLTPDADSNGYRSAAFFTRSRTYQNLVNAMEGDRLRTIKANTGQYIGAALVGTNRSSAYVETERSIAILKDMDEIYRMFCPRSCKPQ